MNYFILPSTKTAFRGRKTTIVSMLNSDAENAKNHNPIIYREFPSIRRHSDLIISYKDLANLRKVAQDRVLWKSLSRYIYLAAYADESIYIDENAKGF